MSDPNHAHEYDPRRKDGKCKRIVSGGSCHLLEDAEVHRRWKGPQWHTQIHLESLMSHEGRTVLVIRCTECGETFRIEGA